MEVSKKSLLVCLAMAIICPSWAQQVSESVHNLQRTYRPLFGNEKSTITLDFLKNYWVGEKDTAYVFLISVGNVSTEAVGYSIGATAFGLFSGVSASGHYTINKTNGSAAFDRQQFMGLYDCISKVFMFSGKRANFGPSSGNSTICTCGAGGVMFGGELAAPGSEPGFYFKLGEGASFKMTQTEFGEIVRVFTKARDAWALRP